MPARENPPWRILVIEDEPMISIDVQDILLDAGFQIAGVAARLDKALHLIEHAVFDAALVDANLAGESATPAAEALTTRGVPFIVLSGYSPEQQPQELRAAPFIAKPCQSSRLVEMLNSVLQKTGNA